MKGGANMKDQVGGDQQRLKRSMLAFMAQSLGQSMMVVAFNYYYIKVFLNVYHIEQIWFQLAQVIYLLWNAINDPLFAYIQDKGSWTLTKSRSNSIYYCAPFYALSFVLPWFSWGSSSFAVGIHLICALLFWDSMMTFVGLATCCLFAEISQDSSHRMKLVQIGNFGSLIGANSIVILEFASDSLVFFKKFQLMAVIIAVCSCMLMLWAGMNAKTKFDVVKDSEPQNDDTKEEQKPDSSYWHLTRQILCNRDFLAFVSTNFLQEFHRTFLSNFMVIFCDHLLPISVIPGWIRSFFYGGLPVIPMIVLILGVPLIRHISYYVTIKVCYRWQMVGGVVLWFIGPNYPWILMAYLLIDSCITNAVFSLFGMPLSDISDKDMKCYQRSRPNSSMIFGTNALIVKPSISICPMIIVAVLNCYGYTELSKKTTDGHESSKNFDVLKTIMFNLICFLPVICGVIQSFTWSFFTIRDNGNEQKRIEDDTNG